MRRAVSAASGVGERVVRPPISALRSTHEFTTHHRTMHTAIYRKSQCKEQYRAPRSALRVPKRFECIFRPPRQRTASTLGSSPRISRVRVRAPITVCWARLWAVADDRASWRGRIGWGGSESGRIGWDGSDRSGSERADDDRRIGANP